MAQGITYTDDQKDAIFASICNSVIEDHLSFNKAVEASEINLVTFYKWITDKKERETLYNYARIVRSDVLFEEIIEIADTTEEGVSRKEKTIQVDGVEGDAFDVETRVGDMIEHRRLKVDARKWVVARMNPKKYGDKLDVTSDGKELKQTQIIVRNDHEKAIMESVLSKE